MTHIDCKYLLVSSHMTRMNYCHTKVKRYSKWCDTERLAEDIKKQVEEYGVCGTDCPGYTKYPCPEVKE